MNKQSRKQCLLVMWLDGFRIDYLKKEWTPYLYRLSQGGLTGEYQPILAFAGIGVSILTGVSPLKHRIWTEFSYDPERSPYKWTKKMPKLAKFIEVTTTHFGSTGQLAKTAAAHLTFKVSNSVSHRTYTPIAHHIPLNILHLFNATIHHDVFEEKCLSTPNIPDLLNKHRISFRILSQSKMRDHQIFREALRVHQDARLVFMQFRELDSVGHAAGPCSKRIHESLLKIDDMVRTIVEEYRKFFQLDVFIFSDHGMVEVRKTVDPLSHLEKMGAREGQDFVMFLDSTLARFWALNDRVKEHIRALMENVGGGRILSEEDFERYQIPAERRYGDFIWVADPGVLILPNYYQGSLLNLGMHGYAPGVREQNSPFIIYNENGDAPKIERIATPMDIFATILDLLQVPAPSNIDGYSLLA